MRDTVIMYDRKIYIVQSNFKRSVVTFRCVVLEDNVSAELLDTSFMAGHCRCLCCPDERLADFQQNSDSLEC